MIKFGSVCSGIEAASVAWHPLGWQAAWLSEIEPFPCAVLKHHYPDVPNHGDMTTLPERILSGEVEAPDVFCGGTPCQAFSVAGLRNSLDDARGNLSLTFVGIANAIDHVRSVRRDAPAIIFWENVPGVLSTKDNAFGCFLGALAGESDPVTCPDGKWSSAGVVVGQTRTVAWRVLDAQYFGVAQRRRRVFVVASARADFDPAKVLFEFNGVRRDIAPSRETGQTIAGTIAARFGISRNNHEECVSTYSTPAIGSIVTDDVSSCISRNTGAGGETQNPAFVVQSVTAHRMVAFGEYSDDGTASAMKARDYKDATDLVAQPMVLMDQGGSVMNVEHDMVGTLRRETHGHEPVVIQPQAVAQPIPLNSMNCFRSPEADPTTGCGIGEAGEAMFTITKANHHAVAQPIAFTTEQTPKFNYDQALTLTKSEAKHNQCIVQPISIHPHCIGRAPNAGPQGKEYLLDGSAYCMDSRGQPQAVAQPIAFEPGKMQRLGRGNAEPGLAPTLRADAGDNQLAVAFAQNQRDEVRIMQVAGALTAEPGMKQQTYLAQPISFGAQMSVPQVDFDLNQTLQAKNPMAVAWSMNLMSPGRCVRQDDGVGALTQDAHRPTQGNEAVVIQQAMAVRRLTATECERLQGFPDGYTNIPWRKKPEAPDGPRYKALGNSWAVPVVAWIGQRIQANIEKTTN